MIQSRIVNLLNFAKRLLRLAGVFLLGFLLLGSSSILLNTGCLGQIPEILDGNAPHRQKGCWAQAWGVTELYRVAALLEE